MAKSSVGRQRCEPRAPFLPIRRFLAGEEEPHLLHCRPYAACSLGRRRCSVMVGLLLAQCRDCPRLSAEQRYALVERFLTPVQLYRAVRWPFRPGLGCMCSLSGLEAVPRGGGAGAALS